MEIIFKYDLKMEWDNLHKGLESKNNPVLPRIAAEMIEKNVDLENKNQVLNFIEDKIVKDNIDIEKQKQLIAQCWQIIEKEAIERMDKLFQGTLRSGIIGYLTLNQRCAYDIDKNYFYININAQNTNSIILHELLHFYTARYIQPLFKKEKLNGVNYNDFKEALTFLLNTNFSDLLGGSKDEGYEKQKKLRIYLEKTWPKFDNIPQFSKYVIKNYFKK